MDVIVKQLIWLLYLDPKITNIDITKTWRK